MGGKARLLTERSIDGPTAIAGGKGAARSARSITVNIAESPLGWLFSRGLVSRRQFEAGERLRADWERAQLAPRVTMAWNATPVSRGRAGLAARPDLNGTQVDARRRFDAAVASAGPGSPTSCGASSVPAMVCARRKPRSAGPLALESWCSASRSIGSPTISYALMAPARGSRSSSHQKSAALRQEHGRNSEFRLLLFDVGLRGATLTALDVLLFAFEHSAALRRKVVPFRRARG